MFSISVTGRVLVLTLDRPEARNAIDSPTAAAIEAAVDRLEGDPELWTGIVTHHGPVFCSGADLKAVAAGGGEGIATARGGFAGLCARARTKPLIAAIEGPAVAGGCEIVLACDLVVASTGASFGLPEVKRALVATGGGPWRLVRSLGPQVGMEMVLTGDPLTGQRAHELGLVNCLVEPGGALAAAHALAERINANAPLAVRESRALALGAYDTPESGLWSATDRASRRNAESDDFREGPQAFIEKRQPRWKGR